MQQLQPPKKLPLAKKKNTLTKNEKNKEEKLAVETRSKGRRLR